MSNLEQLESEGLLILANDIRTEYNKLRQDYHKISIQYYRQPISTQYYKESELREMLDKLEDFKRRYITICDILASKGVKAGLNGHWHDSNNMLFNGSHLLHSA